MKSLQAPVIYNSNFILWGIKVLVTAIKRQDQTSMHKERSMYSKSKNAFNVYNADVNITIVNKE